MEKDLNQLERAILDWIKQAYEDDALSAQIDAASLTKREWTGAGFYWISTYPTPRRRLMRAG